MYRGRDFTKSLVELNTIEFCFVDGVDKKRGRFDRSSPRGHTSLIVDGQCGAKAAARDILDSCIECIFSISRLATGLFGQLFGLSTASLSQNNDAPARKQPRPVVRTIVGTPKNGREFGV